MLGMGDAGDGRAEVPNRRMRPPGNSNGRKRLPPLGQRVRGRR